MNKKIQSISSLPIAPIKRCFKQRAKRYAKLNNTTELRSTSEAIEKLKQMLIHYLQQVCDDVIDLTRVGKAKTVNAVHLEQYQKIRQQKN